MSLDPSVVFVREPGPELDERRENLKKIFVETLGGQVTETAEMQVRSLVFKALDLVSSSKAVFYESQIVMQVMKLAEKPGAVYESILDHPQFRNLVQLTVNEYPLVVIGDTGTFTTISMLEDEQQMVELAGIKSGQHILDPDVVRGAIATKEGISGEQIESVLVGTGSEEDVTVIEGLAGAGKSFTMEAVRAAYEASGYDVMGTAISWTAAKVLQASAKLTNSMALARLLGHMRDKAQKGGEFFHRPSLIIVDEAGMVDTVQMAELLRRCHDSRYPVKVILTGDTLQVTPVAAGAAMETIVERYGSAKIETIRRQVAESDRVCVKLLSERQAGKVVHMMEQKESFVWAQNREDQVAQVVQGYLSYRLAYPDRTALILGSDNETVREINDRIRDALKRLGMIQPTEVADIAITDGRKNFTASFSVGDEVVLRGNNPNVPVYKIDPNKSPVDEKHWEKSDRVGVFNRNNGRIVGIRKCKTPRGSYDFIVDLTGDLAGRVIINSEEFHRGSLESMRALPMTHNYATTVYASQGQTVDQVFFLDSDAINFRLAYVGLSRHRDGVKVYLNENEIHNRMDKGQKQTTKRARENPDLLENVRTHRYSRSEMLQAVAKTWSKNSENLTATLYQLRHMRLGSKKDREKRVEFIRDEADKARVAPLSRQANDMIWNSDLRATVVAEAEVPLTMATAWLNGRDLDATALCGASEGLAKLCAWLHEPELEAHTKAIHDQMMAVRPVAGLWDLEPTPETSQRELAEQFQAAARQVIETMNHRPAIAQEVLDRVTANAEDSLSRTMTNTVRIYTESYPIVNVDDILALEIPLTEPEDMRESDVDLERLATPVDVIPLPDETPGATSSTFLSKLFGSFLHDAPAEAKPAVSRSQPIAKAPKRATAFGVPVGPEPAPVKSTKPPVDIPNLMAAARSWLVSSPRPMREVPFRPEAEQVGAVLAGGRLDFTNVPKTAGAEVSGQGPSELFLQALRGRWWTRGKLNEPRILGRDIEGNICARYALDGTCISGSHYPPAIFNRQANADTPVYIVAGPYEMAWLAERKIMASQKTDDQGKQVGDPASVPHMIWDAKGADYGAEGLCNKRSMAKDLGSTKDVVIVRAKDDPQQEIWARQLQQMLLQQWRVKTKVLPPLPALQPEDAEKVTLPPVPRPRLRRG